MQACDSEAVGGRTAAPGIAALRAPDGAGLRRPRRGRPGPGGPRPSKLVAVTDDRDVRAGDRDRDRVAEVLRDAAGEGYITLDELDERIERALGARTRGELDDLVADLPQAGHPQVLTRRPSAAGAPARAAAPLPAYAGDALELHTRSGKVVQSGRWTVPPFISARAGRWGTVKIDFTAADCPHAEVVIDVGITSWFGDLVVRVPRGWLVRDEDVVRKRLGAVHNRPPEPLAHDGVVVRLTGQVKTGDVWVRYVRPRP